MRSPVELFDDWAKANRFGPRLQSFPKEIADPFVYQLQVFQHRMEQIRKFHFLPGKEIDIHPNFIDVGTCHAFAGFERIGLVAICKGMVMLPLEMFYRMLSHPEVLAGVGNSRLERRGPQHDEGMPEDYDELLDLRIRAGRSQLPRTPICPIRKLVAEVCARLVWRFVAMHEVVHIVHGHVEYLQGVYCVPVMGKGTRATSGTLSRRDLDYQSLELWADWKAAQVVVSGFLTKSPELREVLPNEKQRMFLWSFAIRTLYRMWGLTVDPTKLSGRSHPPTAVRFEMAIGGACHEVAQTIPAIAEEFFELSHGGQREAEKAIAYCAGEQLLPDDLARMNDPLVVEHVDQLMDHHEKVLCPELVKYSHVDLEIIDPIGAHH